MSVETTNMAANLDRLSASANGRAPLVYSVAIRRPSWTDTVSRGAGIPRWRQVIANGDNATTNMSGNKTEVEFVPGDAWQTQQNRFLPPYSDSGFLQHACKGSMCYFSMPSFSLQMDPRSTDNQALTKFYQHSNSVSSKFQGLVFTGELRESLNMIRHPARALRRGIDDYLHKLKTASGKIVKRKRRSFVRDTWLEYAFGWKPLISDIDSAIHAFYLSKAAHAIFEMVSGYGRTVQKVGGTNSFIDTQGTLQWSWQEEQTEELYIKYYGIYKSYGRGVSDSHFYGFKPEEFVPTVWELIPYSFLVDYFTNIGDIISSWSYRTQGPAWTSMLIRREGVKKTLNEKITRPTDDATFIRRAFGNPGSLLWRRTEFSRLATVDPGLPTLELQVPGMSLKWVNILALSKNLKAAQKSINS